MELPVKEIIGAVGTLAVASLGYLQWRRTKRSGRYIEDREAAYNAVWQSLEEIHLYVRGRAFHAEAFDGLMKKANTLLIQHGLHISEADKRHAGDYITALRRLGELLPQVKPDIATTAEQEFGLTRDHVAMPPELMPAYVAYESARAATMERFRHAIGAGQI